MTNPPKIVFLLGAGASCAAGVPAMRQFTLDFQTALTNYNPDGSALAMLLRRIETVFRRHRLQLPLPPDKTEFDLEVLYDFLYAINRPHLLTSRPYVAASGAPVRGRCSELLEFRLKGYIQQRCLEPVAHPQRLGYLKPLIKFAEVSGTLNVASLNYDACIETVSDLQGIPCHTGFDPRNGLWEPSLLGLRGRVRRPIVKLLKLHGSATWYRTGPFDVYRQIQKGGPREAGVASGLARSLVLEAGLLIYPGFGKLPLMGPLIALMAKFQQLLSVADLCIVVGYRLADNHIRQILLDQFRCNQALRLLILSPTQEEADAIKQSVLMEQGEPLRQDRIVAKAKTFEAALRHNWLHRVAQETLDQPLPSGIPAFPRRIRLTRSRCRLPIAEFARIPVWGVVSDSLRSLLYITTGEDKSGTSALWRLDLNSGVAERLAADLRRPRTPVVEQDGTKLYFPENHYRTLPHEDQTFPRIRGLGRVWEIDAISGQQRPITSWNTAGLAGSQIHKLIANPRNQAWYAGKRPLSWPTSVLILEPHRELLLTESRSLVRIELPSGSFQVMPVPLCLNIYGAQKVSSKEAILVDAGVWDAELGSGQVYSLSLPNLRCKVLNHIERLRPKACGFVVSLDRRHLFVTHRFSFPNGSVVEIDLGSGAQIREWRELHLPHSIAVRPGTEDLVVATEHGLQSLRVIDHQPVVHPFY